MRDSVILTYQELLRDLFLNKMEIYNHINLKLRLNNKKFKINKYQIKRLIVKLMMILMNIRVNHQKKVKIYLRKKEKLSKIRKNKINKIKNSMMIIG